MNNRPNDRRATAPPARGGSNNYDRQDQDRGKYQFGKDQDDRNFDQDDSRNVGGNYGRLPPRNSQRADDDYPRRMNEAPARNDRNEHFDPRLPQSDYPSEKDVEGDYRRSKRAERDGYNDEYPDSKDRQLWNYCDRESRKYNEDKNNYDLDSKVSQKPSRGLGYNDPNDYDSNAKSSRPPNDNRNYDYEDEQRGYRNSATNYRNDNLPQRNRDSRLDDSAPPSTSGRNLSFDYENLRSGAGRGDLYERDYGYSKVDKRDNFSSGVVPKAPSRSKFDNSRQSDYKLSKYEDTPQRNDYGYDAKRDDGYDRPQREAFPSDAPRREGYGGDISGRGDRPAATRNSNFAGERDEYALQRSARNEMDKKNRYDDEEDFLTPREPVLSTGWHGSNSADRGGYSSPPPPRSGYNAAGRDVAPPRLRGKDDYGPPRNTAESHTQYTYRSMRGDGYGERRPARDEINDRTGYDRASNNEDKQPVRRYSDQQGNGYGKRSPPPIARRPAPHDYRPNNNQADYSRGYNNQRRDDSNEYKNNRADNRPFNSRGGYDNSTRGTFSSDRDGKSGTCRDAEGLKTSNTSRPEASVKGESYQTPNIGNTSPLEISRPTAAATLCPRLPAPINANPYPPTSNDQSPKSPPPPPSTSAAAPSKIADDDWD